MRGLRQYMPKSTMTVIGARYSGRQSRPARGSSSSSRSQTPTPTTAAEIYGEALNQPFVRKEYSDLLKKSAAQAHLGKDKDIDIRGFLSSVAAHSKIKINPTNTAKLRSNVRGALKYIKEQGIKGGYIKPGPVTEQERRLTKELIEEHKPEPPPPVDKKLIHSQIARAIEAQSQTGLASRGQVPTADKPVTQLPKSSASGWTRPSEQGTGVFGGTAPMTSRRRPIAAFGGSSMVGSKSGADQDEDDLQKIVVRESEEPGQPTPKKSPTLGEGLAFKGGSQFQLPPRDTSRQPYDVTPAGSRAEEPAPPPPPIEPPLPPPTPEPTGSNSDVSDLKI